MILGFHIYQVPNRNYSGQVMHPHHNREMERACMRRAKVQYLKQQKGIVVTIAPLWTTCLKIQ